MDKNFKKQSLLFTSQTFLVTIVIRVGVENG